MSWKNIESMRLCWSIGSKWAANVWSYSSANVSEKNVYESTFRIDIIWDLSLSFYNFVHSNDC